MPARYLYLLHQHAPRCSRRPGITPLYSKPAATPRPGVSYACVFSLIVHASRSSHGLQQHGRILGKSCVPRCIKARRCQSTVPRGIAQASDAAQGGVWRRGVRARRGHIRAIFLIVYTLIAARNLGHNARSLREMLKGSGSQTANLI